MEEKKSKKKVILIAAIILVLFVVIGVLGAIIYTLVNNSKESSEPVSRTASSGLVVDGKINEKAKHATFTTDMNMIWAFPSGNPVSTNAHIGNSEKNKYPVYFEVYLDDEEQELLYTSPDLPVGKQIDQLQLDKALPDGEYDALCTFHILDDKDPTQEISKVSFNVTLVFM